MSENEQPTDTAATAPEAPAQDAPPVEPAPEPQTFDAEYVRKLRDEAAKYRVEARENAAAAERLKEIEDANKSEIQKATERAEAAEALVAEATLKATRAEVAAETGVPVALLTGTSREEIAASAQALIDFRAQQTPARPSSPALKDVDNAAPAVDIDAQIKAAEGARDFRAAIALKQQRAAMNTS